MTPATSARCEKLVVLFTRGMSLEGWHRAGILEREMALYRQLLSGPVGRVALVTYGAADDVKWLPDLPNVEILPNRWGMAQNLYSLLAPWLHRRELRDASVFKTNQVNGAWCGVIAGALFRRPVVVRCGFLWSDSVDRVTSSWWRRRVAGLVERLVLRVADRVVVAGQADRETVARRYGVEPDRLAVVPNYVDTSLFRPTPETVCEKGRVVFVGRLSPEKNLLSLLEALSGIDVRLTVIGDGPLRGALEAQARACGLDVEFLGRVPNDDLPVVLQRAEVFILPSHYEGNPKALIEAMACGVPVIGTRVPGIRDIVTDGETGVLCGTTAPEIRSALVDLLDDGPLRARLRDRGRRFVEQHCSLAIAVEREKALLGSLCGAA